MSALKERSKHNYKGEKQCCLLERKAFTTSQSIGCIKAVNCEGWDQPTNYWFHASACCPRFSTSRIRRKENVIQITNVSACPGRLVTKLSAVVFQSISFPAKQRLQAGLSFLWELKIISSNSDFPQVNRSIYKKTLRIFLDCALQEIF